MRSKKLVLLLFFLFIMAYSFSPAIVMLQPAAASDYSEPELKKTAISVTIGSKEKIRLKRTPKDLISLKYKSADKKTAKVSKKGYVTGVSEGETTVTVMIKYSDSQGKPVSKRLKCKITVRQASRKDKNKSEKNKINLSQAEEWVRAIELGFADNKTDKSGRITYAQFMTVLDHSVKMIDSSILDKWQTKYTKARKSNKPVDTGNAALAIFAAAEAIGGEVYARNTNDAGEGCFSNHWEPENYWGDVNRVTTGFEKLYTEETLGSFIDWSSHYVTSRASAITGKTIFQYEKGESILESSYLTYEQAVLACLRFYESTIFITNREPTSEDEKLLSSAERRKQEILNTVTDVSYAGTAYYVANNGDDNNDGKSPASPWKTIGNVVKNGENGTIKYGDAVFFERGGLWRGEVLNCTEGVTYSAYGVGEKPRIYGSEEDYSGEEKWSLWYNKNGVKIWKLYRDVTEVGNIVFNGGETYAIRKYAFFNGSEWVVSGANQTTFDIIKGLNHDLMFYSTFDLSEKQFEEYKQQFGDPLYADRINTMGPLYLRCDEGNPGLVFQEIEFHQTKDGVGYIGLVNPAGNNVIDNLCIKYSVRNLISIYGEGNENAGNGGNTIQNCDIEWAGGDQHTINLTDGILPEGDVMVCGECIVWKTDNNRFINNYIAQACCAGLVSEFVTNEFVPDITCKNTEISGNIIEKCQDTLFFWDNGGCDLYPNIVFWDGITISDNYVIKMGYGWSGDERFLYGKNNPNNTYHKYGESYALSISTQPSALRNMTVKNNVFYLTLGGYLLNHDPFVEWDRLRFSGNTYVENDNRNIISNKFFNNTILTQDQLRNYLSESLGDKEAKVFTPSVILDKKG